MSPLTFERENPQDIAERATASAQVHDVVVSTSKAIHNKPLQEEDMVNLRWAEDVLSAAASRQAVITMPSAAELSGPFDPVGVLRSFAAGPTSEEDPSELFNDLSKAISSIIDGQRSVELIKALESVRTAFLTVSKMLLSAEVAARTDQAFDGTWLHSMTNSVS